jgi:hypothetical protein
MAKKPETNFKERIYPFLKALNRCWVLKTQLIAVCGVPDFLMCLNGQFVAIELKKDEKEQPSKLQSWVLRKIIAAGGIGLVVHPKNWIAIHRVLVKLSTAEVRFRPEFPDLDGFH